MNDPQQAPLLEELRRVRSEVRGLKRVAIIGTCLLLILLIVVADLASWIGSGPVRIIVSISFGLLLLWILWITIVGKNFYKGAKEAMTGQRGTANTK